MGNPTRRALQRTLGWLAELSRRTGLPVALVTRLQVARSQNESQRLMRHAGKIHGPRDLSSRSGWVAPIKR